MPKAFIEQRQTTNIDNKTRLFFIESPPHIILVLSKPSPVLFSGFELKLIFI
jgi:hypothetical protein